LADRIAEQTLPNGLNVKVGRIEGNIYGKAVLHDLTLSDPKGVFMRVPRAELDWKPAAWLSYRLQIDALAIRRARLERIPEFLASDDDSAILPGFDIAIGMLEVEGLTLAAGIAGEAEERVDLTAKALVEDQRLMVEGEGALGAKDRFQLALDASPDDDVFDLALDYAAAGDGLVAGLIGTGNGAAYRAQIVGDGSWSNWDGGLVVTRDAARFASVALTNRAGDFSALGEIYPAAALGASGDGFLGDVVGERLALDATARIEERRIDGTYRVLARGFQAEAGGLVDLADNRFDDFTLTARVLRPDILAGLLGEGSSLTGAVLDATMNGPMRDLELAHVLSLERAVLGTTEVEGLRQASTARYDGAVWRLPISVDASKIATGNALIDPRLVDARATGDLTLDGNDLAISDLRVGVRDAAGKFAVRGDLARGFYAVAGGMAVRDFALDGVGVLGGTGKLRASFGDGWRLASDISAAISPVSNDTLANLAGTPIGLNGGIAIGSTQPLTFSDMRLSASKLTGTMNGSLGDGKTRLTGFGRHADYGPFTLDANIAGGDLFSQGTRAELVFADPYPAAGLSDVRVALAPAQDGGSSDGFRIATSGGSLLGPFSGVVGLVAPSDGPVRIAVETMTITDTQLTGNLALLDQGVAGDLALSGGGINGTIALDPQASGQGIELTLRARNARFDGGVPLLLARGRVNGSGLISADETSFTGEANGRGLSYGGLFIGRFAAQGELRDGVGKVDASLAGRRGSSFRLDLTSSLTPDRIALAAKGEFAGRAISMPRRAVLTRANTAAGGWRLAPTQVSFGRGGMIASGLFGGDDLSANLQLNQMPLSLIDLAYADLGLGGSISGEIAYSAPSGGLPSGSAKVLIDDLERAGLVLSSRPVDIALVSELRGNRFDLRAQFDNPDIKRGRLRARIANMPSRGTLDQRLRAGNLDGHLRFDGAAESLWRLAGVEAFDLTGPVVISANATGSIADPKVTGDVASDNLQVQSTLSGTEVRGVSARGRFAGSRLRLTRFAGTTPGGGSVSGSGTVDLSDLGERVSGRTVEVRGPRFDLRIAASRARLLDANGLSATISGPLRILSDGLSGTIAGKLTINRASWALGAAAEDLSVPVIATREINFPDDVEQGAAASRPWRYLINATGRSRIDVDGLGLDSEWGADIRLRGTTSAPRIGGQATMVRGIYSFAGTRFELTKGEIGFDETTAIDPRLDIVAETQADDLDVAVNVKGNALQPEISFTSNPALPEEELLARLLFGGSITNLSATDALQLGSALASLRGGGGLDPINQLRSAIGLDRLRIVGADPALDRSTGIAVGKNIGRKFYIELITDGREYSATEVEFRITNWLSLLGSVSTIGRDSIEAEISRDY
jgi:translocation and assembly module TamB